MRNNTTKIGGGKIPVLKASKLTAGLNTGWAAPLSTSYPYRTSLALGTGASNPNNPAVLPTSSNQATDPRTLQRGLYAITGNINQFGNQPIVGGSTINETATPVISTPSLIILFGVILLVIWK